MTLFLSAADVDDLLSTKEVIDAVELAHTDLATGLAVQFGLQAAINMASTIQLIPAKGMTLPLISYGGSSLIAAGLGLGCLLAMTRKRPQHEIDDILVGPRVDQPIRHERSGHDHLFDIVRTQRHLFSRSRIAELHLFRRLRHLVQRQQSPVRRLDLMQRELGGHRAVWPENGFDDLFRLLPRDEVTECRSHVPTQRSHFVAGQACCRMSSKQ